MVLQKSKIIPGWKIFPGKIYGTERSRLLSSLPKKITLIKRISMRTGKTKRTSNSSRMLSCWGGTQFKPSSMVTTLTISSQLWARTPLSSTLVRWFMLQKEVRPQFLDQAPLVSTPNLNALLLRTKSTLKKPLSRAPLSTQGRLQAPCRLWLPNSSSLFNNRYSNFNYPIINKQPQGNLTSQRGHLQGQEPAAPRTVPSTTVVSAAVTLLLSLENTLNHLRE